MSLMTVMVELKYWKNSSTKLYDPISVEIEYTETKKTMRCQC